MSYYSKKLATTSALSKAGVGQATPGALSGASAQKSYPSGSPTASEMQQASPNPIVTIDDQSGQIAPQMAAIQTDINKMTPAFAAKYAEAQQQTIQPAAQAQMMAGLGLPAQNNPLLAGFTGTPPQNPLEQLNSLPAAVTPSLSAAGEFKGIQRTPGLTDPLKMTGGRDVASMLVAPLMGAGMLVGNLGEGTVPFVIGKSAPIKAVAGTAGKFAANTKTAKITYTWMERLLWNLKQPKVIAAAVAGGVVASIGTYPFAGFIKEEALQTTNMGFGTAFRNQDVEGMRNAITMTDNLLSDDVEAKIKSVVPFVNVLDKLSDYFKAARLQNDVNKQLFTDMQIQQASGESLISLASKGESAAFAFNGEKYLKQKQEYLQLELEARRKANEEYNTTREASQARINAGKEQSSAAIIAQNKRAAEELAAFYAEQRRLTAIYEEEERLKIEKFWFEYRKKIAKLNAESGSSRLGFGLLR